MRMFRVKFQVLVPRESFSIEIEFLWKNQTDYCADVLFVVGGAALLVRSFPRRMVVGQGESSVLLQSQTIRLHD